MVVRCGDDGLYILLNANAMFLYMTIRRRVDRYLSPEAVIPRTRYGCVIAESIIMRTEDMQKQDSTSFPLQPQVSGMINPTGLYVFSFWVNPELRGHGVGSQMMRVILDMAYRMSLSPEYGDRKDLIYGVYLHSTTHEMNKLCDKMGFIPTITTPNWMNKGVDAVFYSKIVLP